MKHTVRAGLALGGLIGALCISAIPASALLRRDANSTNSQQATGSTMEPQSVRDNDAVFAAFSQNMDKTNATLDRLTTLLNTIVSRNGQAPANPPAPGTGGN